MKVIFKYFLLLFVLTSFTEPDKTKTQLALKNGTQFLKKIQRNDGAICDTTNSLFDTWETILAATALYEINKDTNEITLKKALTYLRSNENTSGLICHNQKCKHAYCLETTAEYLLLLLKIGETEKVLSRLNLIKELQKPSGEWEIGNPDVTEQKQFPSVTAFMLYLFNETGVKPKYEKEAYSWLTSKQNTNGHWGNAWEYYNCPAYALWPVFKIRSMNSSYLLAIEKANSYILKSQLKNGSWNYTDLTEKKAPSPELQTALMLSALESAEVKTNKAALLKGMNFLISKQNADGSWDGGNFPIKSDRYVKKEYVFATALTLIVLNKDQKGK
jgi:prenyltransferase beta subunit